MKIRAFKQMRNSFCFSFDDCVAPGEVMYLAPPKPNSNHRGINDIGWQTDGDSIRLYGTLYPERDIETAIWDEIPAGCAINKTTNMLKVVNEGEADARIIVKISLF